jgi:hypothetical protein
MGFSFGQKMAILCKYWCTPRGVLALLSAMPADLGMQEPNLERKKGYQWGGGVILNFFL